MASSGKFLEWKQVHGHMYATPLEDMENLLGKGRIVVLKIDVQGAIEAMRIRPGARSIFLLPPSWEELERRIRARAQDAPDKIAERLQNAKTEIDFAPQYQHQIVNDDLEHTVDAIEECLGVAAR
jgi:guanylate kinase